MDPEPYTKKFVPCQVGPHIYENTGELVWSGACKFQNRNAFDFRPVDGGSEPRLSLILGDVLETAAGMKGMYVILNSSYQTVQAFPAPAGSSMIDMHELKVLDGGQRALVIAQKAQLVDTNPIAGAVGAMWVLNNGFLEVDMTTGGTVFEWWALDFVDLGESYSVSPRGPGTFESPWDFFHLNSIDKNRDGDYLISARNANTVYKISRSTKEVLWRLGGRTSTFQLEGFNFSKQHDARFRPSGNASGTSISLLNNAADDEKPGATSAVLLISLDESTMPFTARLKQQWIRQDGKISRTRSNAQFLDNGNVFANWADRGYINEFTADGRCVLEARWLSGRLNTYRAFKANFAGHPSEPPVLSAHAYGTTSETMTTVFHVSWNGATDVASWAFWGSLAGSPADIKPVGSVTKSGFETMYMAAGLFRMSYAEARDARGISLGRSPITNTTIPRAVLDLLGSISLPATPGASPSAVTPPLTELRYSTGSNAVGTPRVVYDVLSTPYAMAVLSMIVLAFFFRQYLRRRSFRLRS
ncbi:hypothetical protein LTR35_003679 [Friedmanniomyces endolithicus]|nr:hypothetical protein LTR35_003679 [Friedmanniomyces endolithicus]KAK0289832.1 hypothetical protein LTS00_008969 [Friedmanniomyces endolithicus]